MTSEATAVRPPRLPYRVQCQCDMTHCVRGYRATPEGARRAAAREMPCLNHTETAKMLVQHWTGSAWEAIDHDR